MLNMTDLSDILIQITVHLKMSSNYIVLKDELTLP